MLTRFVLWLIGRYRATGGGMRWFGVDCNFEPSCSAYAQAVIGEFGLWRGLRLTFNRLRRCNRADAVCKCLEPPADYRQC